MRLRTFFFLLLFTILGNTNVSAQPDTTTIQINGTRFPLPGKWKKVTEYKDAGQYGFAEEDSKLNILISVRTPDGFEFYKRGLDAFDLVMAFYEWNANYWSNGAKVEVLAAHKNSGYIAWKLQVPQGENIFLYAYKFGKLINLGLNNSNVHTKMGDKEAVVFLATLYNSMYAVPQ